MICPFAVFLAIKARITIKANTEEEKNFFILEGSFTVIFPLDEPKWARFNGLSNFCRPFK